MNHVRIPRLCAALALAAAILAPDSGNAQLTNGPSGTFNNTITSSNSLLWDMTVIFSTNLNYLVRNQLGAAVVHVSYPVALPPQNGLGKFAGTGTATVSLTYASPTNSSVFNTAPPITGTYRLNAGIHSALSKTRGFLKSSVTGKADVEAHNGVTTNRTFHSSERVDFVLDDVAQTIAALQTVSVSVAGAFSYASRTTNGAVTLGSTFAGDGTWILAMTLSSTGNKVTGTASVTLNKGSVYPFTIRGVFSKHFQASALTLTGVDLGKGSRLTVMMNGNTVASIKGKVAGQSVHVIF